MAHPYMLIMRWTLFWSLLTFNNRRICRKHHWISIKNRWEVNLLKVLYYPSLIYHSPLIFDWMLSTIIRDSLIYHPYDTMIRTSRCTIKQNIMKALTIHQAIINIVYFRHKYIQVFLTWIYRGSDTNVWMLICLDIFGWKYRPISMFSPKYIALWVHLGGSVIM